MISPFIGEGYRLRLKTADTNAVRIIVNYVIATGRIYCLDDCLIHIDRQPLDAICDAIASRKLLLVDANIHGSRNIYAIIMRAVRGYKIEGFISMCVESLLFS